jgi:predicted P-loop ATPase
VPNKDNALEFLEALTGKLNPAVTFQTFDDNADRKAPNLTRVLHGRLGVHWDTLERLNKAGAGIYVTVNQTDLKGRKKENITAVRAVWTDVDGEPKQKPPLKPSIINKTAGGLHYYWLAKDLKNDECEKVNKLIAKFMGGDKNACDVSRVLRIPGFDHCKGERIEVANVFSFLDAEYPLNQLLNGFSTPEEPQKPKKSNGQNQKSRFEFGATTRYGQTALNTETERIRSCDPESHERNTQLNKSAYSLGQLVAGQEVDESAASSELLSAAISTGLKEREARSTIRSGIESGKKVPRSSSRGNLALAHSNPEFEPEMQPDPPGPKESWEHNMSYTRVGKDGKDVVISKDPGNIALILINSPIWKGTIAFDGFGYSIQYAKDCPKLEGLPYPKAGEKLEEHHIVYFQQLFKKYERVSFSKDMMFSGIEMAAQHNTYHPVKNYLKSLKWDKKERIKTWLSTYMGAELDEKTCQIGLMWLVSAMARVMRPGCQADHTLILEGPQGVGKSTALRILAGQWYQGNLGNLRDKDSMGNLAGHWIVEIDELDAFRGMASTLVKRFLTQTVDQFRPPYGRLLVERPRQCVFCGTTNEEHYLHDPTGGRRFWPVSCGRLDLKALKRDRDQIWAEAYRLYKTGFKWWPDEEMTRNIAEIQEKRFDHDPWEEIIVEYIKKPTLAIEPYVTIRDILEHCLEIEIERQDRRVQMRIAAILRRAGYKRKQRMDDGKRSWVYVQSHGVDFTDKSEEPKNKSFEDIWGA